MTETKPIDMRSVSIGAVVALLLFVGRMVWMASEEKAAAAKEAAGLVQTLSDRVDRDFMTRREADSSRDTMNEKIVGMESRLTGLISTSNASLTGVIAENNARVSTRLDALEALIRGMDK